MQLSLTPDHDFVVFDQYEHFISGANRRPNRLDRRREGGSPFTISACLQFTFRRNEVRGSGVSRRRPRPCVAS